MDAWLLTDGIEIDRELARAYDIYAVPVLVFERQHVVKGLQPYSVLAHICARLEAEADGETNPAAQGRLRPILERDAVSI
jgi:predicted DsbA family dithiol-disulfide isomerase